MVMGSKSTQPMLKQKSATTITASHPELGDHYLYCEDVATLLFTENETNTERIDRIPNRTPYVKDGINNYIVHNRREAVNPSTPGPKHRPIIRSRFPGADRAWFVCVSLPR